MDVDLSDLRLLSSIAKHLSFRQASQELGVSASAISHAVRAVEAKVGVRLFSRTTRSVALTPAGRQLLERIAPALQDIAQALDGINEFRDSPQGLIRINAPRPAGELVLAPLVSKFLKQYPRAQIELVLDDAFVDIVREGYDAGVRYGESLHQDMVAVALGPPQRFVVVAAPALVEQYGRPLSPRDLLDRPCVGLRFPSGARYQWEFEKNGERMEVDITGRLTVGEMPLVRQAAMDGLGYAYMYAQYAHSGLTSGQLVSVLDDWCPAVPGFFLYYPSRRLAPATLRAFVDTVKAHTRECLTL